MNAAVCVLLCAVLGVTAAGCGKYGKPVRTPPEPQELSFRRANVGETSYKFDTVSGREFPPDRQENDEP